MPGFRYSRWDGSQDPLGPELDVASLVDALSDDLLEGADAQEAIDALMRRGLQGQFGGLDSVMRRIREARDRAAESGRIDGMLDDLRQELEAIVDAERAELSFQEGDDARFRESLLESLPPEPAGQIAGLTRYEFASPVAAQRFQALLENLRQQMMSSVVRDMTGAMQAMTPEQVAAMRDMLADLNRMIAARRNGTGPSDAEFTQFMNRHGSFFPENPATFDALLDSLARRAAAMSRLLSSLSEDQRAELMAVSDQIMSDLGLAFEVSQLTDALREFFPQSGWDERSPLSGERPLGMSEALDAIEEAADLDDLERAVRGAQTGDATLNEVDLDRVRARLGDETSRDLDRLRRVERALQEAGVVSRKDGRFTLTPRGIRALGQRALQTVFASMRQDRSGRHDTTQTGSAAEPTGSSRAWRFGDPFRLDVGRTVGNAVLRTGPASGRVHILPQDFEIAEVEGRTRTATVLLLDMSFSMPMRGNWAPAKRMALALHALISTQYPDDVLHIVGFSDYARVMTPEDLAHVEWERVYGTNMEHAFNLAGRLLAKYPGANKQALLVTDGEPTAHLDEFGNAHFNWPPLRITLEKTYAEALRLAKAGVTMNIFMLEDTDNLFRFIDTLARVVKGRVFSVPSADVGPAVLRDYLTHRHPA